MNLYDIVELEIDAASGPAGLVRGHVDEIVDAAADGKAEVTEGPQDLDPVRNVVLHQVLSQVECHPREVACQVDHHDAHQDD